ncbi:MAG: glycerol-3-phosphate 1-O-acyltransferase PlsB [Burkholderiales bacterium]|nr:glycerol-3-phosphate 1-O-acyltransferase PlsB [Burkholderiales bacterium]
MTIRGLLYAPQRAFHALVRITLAAWVKVQCFPEPLRIADGPSDAPVFYVLPRPSLTDGALLDHLTRHSPVPRSHQVVDVGGRLELRACFALYDDRHREASPRLARLTADVLAGRVTDVRVVPVSIYWGRAPDREAADPEWATFSRGMRWLRIWAAEGWGGRSRLRKLLAIVFFRTAVVAKFADAVSLAAVVRSAQLEGLDDSLMLRRAARLLRTHFRNEREAAIGPDLSHRRTLIGTVLREPRVRAAMLAEVDANKGNLEKIEKRAERIAREIAADYSYVVVRLGERILGRLWNRIYDGLTVRGAERLQALARDNTLVYVPCHRSHIDYLLLSYLVYDVGLTAPHIAAGANLNLPVIGSILRRGGAFFLRRSIKGDELYSEIFAAYVHEVLRRGFPMEYFVEGGRSRTGRLLPPKAGLISMTVQSFLREHSRPLLFVPVYIGYEKLIEGGSYTEELSGASKRKESIGGVLGAIRDLRGAYYGQVGVSFARPISLAEVLEAEGARDITQWVADKGLRRRTLTEVSRLIAERINGAAHLNPVALVATALLATPRHAMDAAQLADIVERLRRVALASDVAPELVATELSGAEMIAHAERLAYLSRRTHPLGDVVLADENAAVTLTYFRNNVLHCFALPGVIACLVAQHGVIGRQKLARLARQLYALLETELYLPPWRLEDDAATAPVAESAAAMTFAPFERTLGRLIDDGWLSLSSEADVISAAPAGSEAAMRLAWLAATIRSSLTRHALLLALAVGAPSGSHKRSSIETLGQQAAQHLAMTHVFNAPEFSDRTQFRAAFDALMRVGWLSVDDNERVQFDSTVRARADEASFLLPPDTRAAVLRAAEQQLTTQLVAPPGSPPPA